MTCTTNTIVSNSFFLQDQKKRPYSAGDKHQSNLKPHHDKRPCSADCAQGLRKKVQFSNTENAHLNNNDQQPVSTTNTINDTDLITVISVEMTEPLEQNMSRRRLSLEGEAIVKDLTENSCITL